MAKPHIKGRGFLGSGNEIIETQTYYTQPENDWEFDENQKLTYNNPVFTEQCKRRGRNIDELNTGWVPQHKIGEEPEDEVVDDDIDDDIDDNDLDDDDEDKLFRHKDMDEDLSKKDSMYDRMHRHEKFKRPDHDKIEDDHDDLYDDIDSGHDSIDKDSIKLKHKSIDGIKHEDIDDDLDEDNDLDEYDEDDELDDDDLDEDDVDKSFSHSIEPKRSEVSIEDLEKMFGSSSSHSEHPNDYHRDRSIDRDRDRPSHATNSSNRTRITLALKKADVSEHNTAVTYDKTAVDPEALSKPKIKLNIKKKSSEE